MSNDSILSGPALQTPLPAVIIKFVVEAITTKLFVDDYLSSAATVEQGIQEAKGVMQVLSRGDMHLQDWLLN
jgi:hypothetical protein